MHAIADLDSVHVNGTTVDGELQLKYKAIIGAKMYWPGTKKLEDVLDEPKCGFDGSKCVDQSQKEKGIFFIIVKYHSPSRFHCDIPLSFFDITRVEN